MGKKKIEEPKIIHDFSINKIFRGWLLNETPENYLFEDEEGTEIIVKKTPGIDKAMDAVVNGVKVREGEWLIELEFLGSTVRASDQTDYQRFKVSVEPDN